MVKSISDFVMLPLLPYLISPALSKHSAASMMPMAGIQDRRLAFIGGLINSFHSVISFLIKSDGSPSSPRCRPAEEMLPMGSRPHATRSRPASKCTSPHRRDALTRHHLPLNSPFVKIGRMFSNSLIFLTSIPCSTPRLVASFACQPSTSAMSTVLG